MGASILLDEDEVNMARTLAKNLERAGYEVLHAPQGQAALETLQQRPIDVVITDLKMPIMDGMALLRAMHDRSLAVATIVLTGFGTIESAVEAMKLGAADYLIKDARPQEILMTVERVLELTQLRRENAQLKREIGRIHRSGELIGESPAMNSVHHLIDAVSQNRSTVLLTGESGTGKELVARTIHQRGPTAARLFLAVNCAGLSETLLDSQLFGHRRGAFTGAVADHDGMFRAAEGGTLFLDEVSEIPLGLQAKFLRAVQEREVTPLGAARPVAVNVRLIAATNRDLDAEVKAGRFRADLFYRLNVVRIELPPLRDRLEDLEPLVDHFVARFSAEYRVAAKRVSAEALAALRTHGWPGNVRELENPIERAFAVSRADVISREDLPPSLTAGPAFAPLALPSGIVQTLAEAERQTIAAALRASGGNKNEAARRLGIDRQRLYRKIDKYGLS